MSKLVGLVLSDLFCPLNMYCTPQTLLGGVVGRGRTQVVLASWTLLLLPPALYFPQQTEMFYLTILHEWEQREAEGRTRKGLAVQV